MGNWTSLINDLFIIHNYFNIFFSEEKFTWVTQLTNHM